MSSTLSMKEARVRPHVLYWPADKECQKAFGRLVLAERSKVELDVSYNWRESDEEKHSRHSDADKVRVYFLDIFKRLCGRSPEEALYTDEVAEELKEQYDAAFNITLFDQACVMAESHCTDQGSTL